MTQAAPTFNQIKAQVAAIRKKIPSASAVAIRATGRWDGDAVREDDGETYFIRQCDSPLAMRIALREGGDRVTKVLITNVDERQISEDILVRLKPRQVVPLDGWQIVKSLFQARAIDPRITRHSWIADILMDVIPTGGFTPVASGFLDAETVWAILLDRQIGLDVETPDLLSLLTWSVSGENVGRLRATGEPFQAAARDWLAEIAGPSAATVLACAALHEQPDAVSIGLAAGVVFHPQAVGELQRAVGKLEERYLGGDSPASHLIGNWHAAATDVVRIGLGDPQLKQRLLARADEILREVGADSRAWLSDTSPIGFDQRLEKFGQQLTSVLLSHEISTAEPLAEAAQAIHGHERCARERRRLQRVQMAMRLVRWLAQRDTSPQPASLAEAAGDYLREGGFVDWARLALRTGDPLRELSEAYARLFDRVTAACEERAEVFARLLVDWTAASSSDDLIVPVEQILDRIVAPLAGDSPVLVIVIDGMSVAVFRELMDDMLEHDWLLLAEEGVGLRPGLATVPSVTEVSRTSLLCGERMQGSSANEATGFAQHAGLVDKCRSGYPPVLFHKASLQESEDAGLAAEIRREIASPHRKIVGVVVNAVDDHLLKGQQIDTQWTRDEIKVLPALLQEAKMARRTVVMLSDHGHILECNTRFRQNEGGERWRTDEGEPAADELRIRGPRVVMPDSHTLIAPWSEKVRYGMKKNGYHGGLCPQEMVIPIAVLAAGDRLPAGWSEAPVDVPIWWDASLSIPNVAEEEVVELKPPARRETLFDLEEEEPARPAPTAKSVEAETPTAEWILALLASPMFAEQKQISGRAIPSDELFAQLLTALDSRGGKLTSAALARAMNFPSGRLRGLLVVASRVLNLDGYFILTRDDPSDTIELDRPLLLKQFDLV